MDSILDYFCVVKNFDDKNIYYIFSLPKTMKETSFKFTSKNNCCKIIHAMSKRRFIIHNKWNSRSFSQLEMIDNKVYETAKNKFKELRTVLLFFTFSPRIPPSFISLIFKFCSLSILGNPFFSY